MEREQTTEIRARAERGRAFAPALDAQELAAVFAGGFLGAVLRSALAESLHAGPGRWPWATFAVNILSALLLGFLVTHLQERQPPSLYARSFLGSGLCGALSTFSTMMVEVLDMVRGSYWTLALAYASASIVCGLAAILLSTKLVRRARLLR